MDRSSDTATKSPVRLAVNFSYSPKHAFTADKPWMALEESVPIQHSDMVTPIELNLLSTITEPFAHALIKYITWNEQEFTEALKSISADPSVAYDFTKLSLSELLNTPVTDSSTQLVRTSQQTAENSSISSGDLFTQNDRFRDLSRKLQDIDAILAVPRTLTGLQPINYFISQTPVPPQDLSRNSPYTPDITVRNVREALLNTQGFAIVAGNLFTEGAIFGVVPGGGANIFFEPPVRSGSIQAVNSFQIVLITPEHNSLTLYTKDFNGHHFGDFIYRLNNPVPHLLNTPPFDVSQSPSQPKILTEHYLYNLVDNEFNISVGNLDVKIVDDVPVATPQIAAMAVLESAIITSGSSQSTIPNVLTGNLISPPLNQFGADGGTVSNVTILNGNTVITPTDIVVTTLQGNQLLVNKANGTYQYHLNQPFTNINNQPAVDIFTYVFTDNDRDSKSATLTITIEDDSPIAKTKLNWINETLLFVNGFAQVQGNLLTDSGFGVSLFGADHGHINRINHIADGADGMSDGIIHAATTYGSIVVYQTAQNGHSIGDYIYQIDVNKTNGVSDALLNVTDIISYELIDNDGSLSSANLLITIALNQPPLAQDDDGITDQNTILNVPAPGVLSNDLDPNMGDTQSVIQINGLNQVGAPFILPSGAIVQINTDGAYRYDPNGQFGYLPVGTQAFDSFTYTMQDAQGLTSSAHVNLIITGVNEAPVAQNDSNTTSVSTLLTVNSINSTENLLYNDSDIDNGAVLAIHSVEGLTSNVGNQIALPSGALLTVQSDGNYSYDPNSAFLATTVDSFSYDIVDVEGAISNPATVSITVTVPPVILDLSDSGISLLPAHAAKIPWYLAEYDQLFYTGWVSPDNGILVYDYNEDRLVTQLDEFSFVGYDQYATTDLEGLRLCFDTNGDNILDFRDEHFSKFGIWQDLNSNGKTEPGEFKTLSEWDIISISLVSDNHVEIKDGNIIYGYSSYQTSDGVQHQLADVGLGCLPHTIESILENQIPHELVIF